MEAGNKINFLELESIRGELIERSLSTGSYNYKLYLHYTFFSKILALKNTSLENSFLPEFINEYLYLLSKYEVWGTDPEISFKIIEQLEKLLLLNSVADQYDFISAEKERIALQLHKQQLILAGKEIETGLTHKAFFPLMDNEGDEKIYGVIESVNVIINKAADKDSFIIIPSEKEVEIRILRQCTNSWQLALTLSNEYIKKPFKYHDVIISFDRKDVIYEGNSLGIALTLTFLEQLLKFYNPPYVIKIKENSAFTGGISPDGEILCTGEDIIKKKAAVVFFSEVNSFVFPKMEEGCVNSAIELLKQSYPDRRLKVIPVEDINDVINRRDLVDIKKQNPVLRGGKFLKQNWVSAAFAIIFTILFTYVFAMDFDDNPAEIYYDSGLMFIKNKNNKTLFTFPHPLLEGFPEEIDNLCRIVDINDDGINEIIFVESTKSVDSNNLKISSLSCYNKDKELIWNYYFDEIVSSDREVMIPEYGIIIVDTLTGNGKKTAVVYACNGVSFASALFKIDLATGEKCSDEFWSSGHINSGILADINGDNLKEFIGWGPDNGFQQPVLWAVDINHLKGARPSTREYTIHGETDSSLIFYIRIPKTDYDYYVNFRSGYPMSLGLNYQEQNKVLQFNSGLKPNKPVAAFLYRLNVKNMDINIFVDDHFRLLRDSLLVQGKLSGPVTDSKEYIDMHKKQILYWHKGKWLKYEDYVNEKSHTIVK
jgi:hypothetical protein